MVVTIVYGAAPGSGGLGGLVANAIRALAAGNAVVHAIGPAPTPAVAHEFGARVVWHAPAEPVPRLVGGRWRAGAQQFAHDVALGRFGASTVAALRPSFCYAFTQVALETLEWAHAHGVPTVLENPNGHIRNFRQVYLDEARRWCHGIYIGHPSRAMVERVEREYLLADHVRVSSAWARHSMAGFGVAAGDITVLPPFIDVERFHPAPRPPSEGALRVCFVGTLDLRKGFAYLLEALRTLPPGRATLEVVGATGDWCSRRLFERLSTGLVVQAAPGDPVPALQRAELFVLPTLEDGFGFVVAEAMACGVPVVTTREAGAAEWVREGQTGWIVPPRDAGALAAAIQSAIGRRHRLADMGAAARADVMARGGRQAIEDVHTWISAIAAAAGERVDTDDRRHG